MYSNEMWLHTIKEKKNSSIWAVIIKLQLDAVEGGATVAATVVLP